jgi:hypothetical protein
LAPNSIAERIAPARLKIFENKAALLAIQAGPVFRDMYWSPKSPAQNVSWSVRKALREFCRAAAFFELFFRVFAIAARVLPNRAVSSTKPARWQFALLSDCSIC